jgi:hypothetical protein
MPAYNKFQDFAEQFAKGVHHFGTDTFKLALTNVAPVASQVSFDPVTAHAAPVAADGYPTGGATVVITATELAGVLTVAGDAVTFTAGAGGIGPFRYCVLYNDSATSPADALVAWWDHGSSISLTVGQTFTVNFNNDPTAGSIFTFA